MKRKVVLSAAIAILALGARPAIANSAHSADMSGFVNACAYYYWGAQWDQFRACAVTYWYGRIAYNSGRADSAENMINNPGWPVMCPQGRESENPICADTYEEFELYDEAAELAEGERDYWLYEWTPPF